MTSVVVGTSVTLEATYGDDDGDLVDPVNPRVSIIDPTDTVRLGPVAPTRDATGRYHVDYMVPIGGPVGTWYVHWTGTIAGQPSGSGEGFDVVASSSSGGVSGSSPLAAGPCEAWSVDLCCDVTGVDQGTVDRMVMAATEVYWGLSGRQFGVCQIPPLRPCRRDCFDGIGWTEWAGGNPYMPGPFIPASRGGLYFNLTCGACIGDCSCDALEEVALPSPVAEVVQVKIDGAVLAPSAYRVDNWNTLVRIDGGVFPTCQTMRLADTAVGTMSVTVKVGKAVPVLGELAVAELACELIAGCREPNECLVPAHIVARTRAGVSESFIDLADIVKYKLTGLPAGDYFLRTFNPSGLSSRSSVHSPDYRPARRAGT